MAQHHILGLSQPGESCPLCDVKPQIFRQTQVEHLVECGRCGLPSAVDLNVEPQDRVAQPVASAGWLNVFRRYWDESGRKITHPAIIGDDVELRERMRALDDWLKRNQGLVAAATLATAAPYSSITAIVVQVQKGHADEVRKAWQLLLPHEAIGAAIQFPIDPEPFDPGTIVTIQTPNQLPGAKADV